MNLKKSQYKFIMFDMDGTLLNGRSIFIFAEKLGFSSELSEILKTPLEPYEKSIKIAKLLQGMDSKNFLKIFRKIPLQDHVHEVIKTLKEKNIRTAIVTDSYQFLADDLKERLKFDYAFANKLIIEKNIIVGDLIINNTTHQRNDDGKLYSICKGSVFDALCEMLDIEPEQTIAVGDGLVDIDMIKKSGLGIAYKAREEVQKHADIVADDLRIILTHI